MPGDTFDNYQSMYPTEREPSKDSSERKGGGSKKGISDHNALDVGNVDDIMESFIQLHRAHPDWDLPRLKTAYQSKSLKHLTIIPSVKNSLDLPKMHSLKKNAKMNAKTPRMMKNLLFSRMNVGDSNMGRTALAAGGSIRRKKRKSHSRRR